MSGSVLHWASGVAFGIGVATFIFGYAMLKKAGEVLDDAREQLERALEVREKRVSKEEN